MAEFVDKNEDGKDDKTGETRSQFNARQRREALGGTGSTTTGFYTDGRTVNLGTQTYAAGRPSQGGYVSVPKTGQVDDAKNAFSGGLLSNDPNTISIAQWMYKAGVIKYDITQNFEQGYVAATKAYNTAVERTADANQFGNANVSVLDMLSMKIGSAAPGGPSTTKQFTSYTKEQAKQKAVEAYKTILGRAPTQQEIDDFSHGLISSAKAHPTIQRTSASGKTQRVTQGFDERTWTFGYMAAKIPANQDLAGSAGVAQDTVKRLSEQYGYKPSSIMSAGMVNDIIQQRADATSTEQKFKEQAKILFPHLSDKIDAGLTVRAIADSYINNVSTLLEKNPTNVDLFNPYVREALQQRDANGQYVLPTADEHARIIRSKPEWLKTNNGKETLMSAADNILKQMGFE